MTKTEFNKYKQLLETKQTELAGGLRNREGIAIEKTADALDEVQLAGERERAIRARPHGGRILWGLPALRGRHQPEALERGTVDCLLHQMPGSSRSARV